MTHPPHDESPARSPATKRILIGVGGVILLVLGAVITLGVELIGVAAILVGWYLMRRRERTMSRPKAWFVSVGVTAVPLLVLFAVSMLSAPRQTTEQRRRDLAAAQARRRDSMPDFFKKLAQRQQTTAMSDSIAQRLVENGAVMAWMQAMGALIASGMIALFVGTIAWASTMLLFRAVTDDWMGVANPPPAEHVQF